MRFDTPLTPATLVKRYKRFLADCTLPSGEIITAHCANPGAMLDITTPGLGVYLSRSDNPKRKLAYSLEMVVLEETGSPRHIGVNTGHPNRLVEEAISGGLVPELSGYSRLRREVRYGRNSRIDILLDTDGENTPPCYVEVKNVHLIREPGLAEFPDSVTARGAKHLGELSDVVAQGARAVMVYLVQRNDCDRFTVAGDIDPTYQAAFAAARTAGVEALCLTCRVSPEEITVDGAIPVLDTIG